MVQLLRKYNTDLWAKYDNDPSWMGSDCPFAILRDVYDEQNSLSMWRISNQGDLPRVVAAQVIGQSSVSREFTFLLTNQEDVQKLGIIIQQKDADTIDGQVNKMHVELFTRSASQLVRLAGLLRQGEPRVMRRDEILVEVKRCFAAGYFDRTKMVSQSKLKRTGALLAVLWKERRIDWV